MKHKIFCKDNVHKLLIQFFFILLIVIFVYVRFALYKINNNADFLFNYQRLIECYRQIIHWHWSLFNMNSSLPYGNATSIMYPRITIILFSLIHLMVKQPITIFNVYFSIQLLIGLEIAYFACRTVAKRRLTATIFSISYCMSTMILDMPLDNDLGNFTAILVLPLAFFGWINWVKYNHWLMMSIGMILALYSHIIDTGLMAVTLAILTIFFFNNIKNKKSHLVSLLKSIVLFAILTSIVWLPMIYLMYKNNILMPFPGAQTSPHVDDALDILDTKPTYFFLPERSNFYRVLSFSDLVAIPLIIIYWKHLKNPEKKFSIVALIIILFNEGYIKHFLMSYTFFNHIQYIGRVGSFDHLIISFVFSLIVVKILMKRWHIQNVVSLLSVLLIIIIGSIFMVGRISRIVYNSGMNIPHSEYLKHIKANKSDKSALGYSYGHSFTIKLNNTNINSYMTTNNKIDYFSQRAGIHFNLANMGLTNKKQNVVVHPKQDGKLGFHCKNNVKYAYLPYVMFNGFKYNVTLDGHSCDWKFNQNKGYVQIYHIKHGSHIAKLNVKGLN